MMIRHRLVASAALLSILTVCLVHSRAQEGAQNANRNQDNARENAYRANNVGVALLEQFKYEDGVNAFQKALKIDPKLTLARINLSIALYNVPDLATADKEAKAAIEEAPSAPQPHYIRGLVARSANNTVEAIAEFKRVLDVDPYDVGANVNLGQIYSQQRQLPEAIAAFRAAVASEPYNVTAAYNLATALIRAGQKDEGQQTLQRFQQLRQSGAGTVIGPNYLEQGRYSEAIASTGSEADLVKKEIPAVTFTDATSAVLVAPKPGDEKHAGSIRRGAVTLCDVDNDGDLDLFDTSAAGERLFRNDGGKFSDVSDKAGFADRTRAATGSVAGDFDNDGFADLFVFRPTGVSLYRNENGVKFVDATTTAKLPAFSSVCLSAAFVDLDHDGDLDLFVCGAGDQSKQKDPAPLQSLPSVSSSVFRNNGDGTFVDFSAGAKVDGAKGHAVAVVPTDYDNRRDVDLLVSGLGDAPRLMRNVRDGSFVDVAPDVGLATPGAYTSVAACDVNKDGFTDFFFGQSGGAGAFALSDGRGRFTWKPGPDGATDVRASQFVDYDQDGVFDLVASTGVGLKVWRNVGDGWQDVSTRAIAENLRAIVPNDALAGCFACGDIDGDGDQDIVLSVGDEGLVVARNDGGSANRSLRIQLSGKVSNRTGIGAKIEARAGSLWQQLEFYSANPAPAPSDIVFGLGSRQSVDAVRVLWPAGVIQAEIQAESAAQARSLSVQELDRKPSSCPFLYAWNGERFEFITDFMGGGEMGSWVAPGIRNFPDPTEYVRIRSDQLRPKNGRYEIRVTNELEEALYVDELKLAVVDHPVGVEVFPNEGLRSTSGAEAFNLFSASNLKPVASAEDSTGEDVTERLASVDRRFVEGIAFERIRGYAREHTLTMNLGNVDPDRAMLFLTGWTDYAFSSDNVAASQMGLAMAPPRIEVRDASGQWQVANPEIGFPVGRPQTVTVDLRGKFLSESREVRIVTNMRIYWDQALVGESVDRAQARLRWLRPLSADLHWRGFSAEVMPDGKEPIVYDYDRVSPGTPWKLFPGRYTREGDVRALVGRTDDMFVISRTGDEISLSFDAQSLGRVRPGWTRTFLLYADGFSKEMDINSGSPDYVAPLPFHKMTVYPYGDEQSYPDTPAHRAYRERYNTRIVTRAFEGAQSRLSTVFLAPPR